MKKYLLLAFLPFLFGFTGPGPRNDGRIYMVDYVAFFSSTTQPTYPGTPVKYIPTPNISGLQAAENDAAIAKVRVEWDAATYYVNNLLIPIGVVNELQPGTLVVAWTTNPVFVLQTILGKAVGPFEIDGGQVNTTGPSVVYAQYDTTGVRVHNVGMTLYGANSIGVDLEGPSSNYPVEVGGDPGNYVGIYGGAYGFYAKCMTQRTRIHDVVFTSQTAWPIKLDHPSSCTSHVTSQNLEFADLTFNFSQGDIYLAGPADAVTISHIADERYTQVMADTVFDISTGSVSGVRVLDSIGLGNNARYSMCNVQGLLVENTSLSSPIQATYPALVMQLNDSGATTVVTPPCS